MKHWIMGAALMAFLVSGAVRGQPGSPCRDFGAGEHGGRYGSSRDTVGYVVRVARDHGELTMWPLRWSGRVVLQQVARDSFAAFQYGRPTARFERNSSGCVVALVSSSEPDVRFDRLVHGVPRRPLELLMDGEPIGAARLLQRASPGSFAARASELADELLDRPSMARSLVSFLEEIERLAGANAPGSARLEAALGRTYIAAGDRGKARQRFLRASQDGDSAATLLLARLDSTGATEPRLAFQLSELFAEPTRAEVDSARGRLQAKRLIARDARIVRRDTVAVAALQAEARVVEHTIAGRRHLGIVLVPLRRSAHCCKVIGEARGVAWNFPPLRVPSGLTSPWVLGDAANDVVYVVPAFGGEAIILGVDTLRAEGDARNAWAGATDDYLAFLHAALSVTPEADSSRVCAFGRSRGGTVAMLAGARDPLIDCVVAWAAPVDWFREMTSLGWSPIELMSDALRRRLPPNTSGGQRVNVTLEQALVGRESLSDVRGKLIASSPLYFAAQLPLTQAHWGQDDGSVPSRNGIALARASRASKRPARCLEVVLHQRAGHDMDRLLAPLQSRTFLLRALALSEAAIERCRKAG
jgi:hypothetical protein